MIKNVLASVAAMGLMVAPIAAQAGTRAAESGVSMSSLARVGAPVGAAEGDERPTGFKAGGWLLPGLFGLIGIAVVLGLNSGRNLKSPD